MSYCCMLGNGWVGESYLCVHCEESLLVFVQSFDCPSSPFYVADDGDSFHPLLGKKLVWRRCFRAELISSSCKVGGWVGGWVVGE